MKERLSAISEKTGQRKGNLIVLGVMLAVALVTVGCSLNSTAGSASYVESDPEISDIQDVLMGDQQFLYAAGGNAEASSVNITDIPSLFDPDDDSMAIQNYAVVDLDSDGTDEAVIFVCGAAGDTGGYIVLHSINGHVYGYRTDYRMFENLKTDGTFIYSDDLGTKEGVAVIRFAQDGPVLEDVLSATGQAYTMNSFMIDGKQVTEEEYNTEKEKQDLKNDVEWRALLF